jgi:hypothetical protein
MQSYAKGSHRSHEQDSLCHQALGTLAKLLPALRPHPALPRWDLPSGDYARRVGPDLHHSDCPRLKESRSTPPALGMPPPSVKKKVAP